MSTYSDIFYQRGEYARKRCEHETVSVTRWRDGAWQAVATIPKGLFITFPCDRAKCVSCGATMILGPANDDDPRVVVELRAAEIASAWKGRREPFDMPLTAAEKSGCDKWPYLDPTNDELAGFLAVQIINHHAEQAGHTFTGQHRVANHDENRETE